jgi:hypothetical protein
MRSFAMSFLRRVIFTFFLVGLIPPVLAEYRPISLSPIANADLTLFPEPVPFFPTGGVDLPTSLTGSQVLGGVPFVIGTSGLNGWNGFNAPGPNPRTVDIPVSVKNVQSVHTLLNTYWGQPGPQSYASIEFFGSSGSYYRKDLVGGVDIRDFNVQPNGLWPQTINETTTKQVAAYNSFGLGQRLDKQEFSLPEAFRGQTLDFVRLTDNGGDALFQRLVLSGLTVDFVPTVHVALKDFQASGVLGYQHLGSETTFGSSGVFRLQTEDPAGTLASLVGSTAFAFCIELSQSYTSTFEDYFVGDLTTANSPLGPNGPITQAQQDLVAQLWARHFDPTWKAAGPYSPEDVTRSMAFHASILEILADFDGSSLGSIDLDAGDFKLINGYLLDVNDPSQELQVRMVANGFLSSLTASYSGRLPRLLALTNERYQDYLVEAVPEIQSVILSFLGLMTLVFFRSRLRRLSETIR